MISQYNTKRTVFWLIIAVFFVVFDRFFKSLAINGFLDNKINLIKDWFGLQFVANSGIAFSLPLSGDFLSVLIIFVVFVLVFYLLYFVKKNERKNVILLTFLLFGAISNLVDRLRFGFVVDYLDLKYFTVFNLADIMIVSAITLFILNNFKKV